MRSVWLYIVAVLGAALVGAKWYIKRLAGQRDQARDEARRAEAHNEQVRRREHEARRVQEDQRERHRDESERLREGRRDHFDNPW